METGNVIVFALDLFAAAFFVGVGIPCSQGWVRPNPIYGFRTPTTLRDPDVWYATNRVAGYWGIATGLVGAVVCVSTFLGGLGLPQAAWINAVPFLLGIAGTLIHGFLVIRRASGNKQTVGSG